jgi:hypothetical protein
VKLPGFVVALSGSFCLAVSLQGHEVTTCKSPDGKFALRCVYANSQPYNGDTAIVETATNRIVLPLDSNWTIGQVKLMWSPDSQRDGKMHEIERSIFPVPDSEEDRWQFEVPREGRTIIVRARKGGKVLHKVTWNGEKFQREKP